MTNKLGSQEQQASANSLLGTWKLQSFTLEYADTREKLEPFGAHPHGYLGYGPDGRMYAIIVHERRGRPPEIPSDAEKIDLFSGMGAYAGTYKVDGEIVRHYVDISWIESWTGTTQLRRFRVDGNLLYIQSPAAKDPLDGRISSAVLVWAKIQ
ncbi:MAG: lipocalin-like domain-containing protein [Steroidobacteraceae bacterium]